MAKSVFDIIKKQNGEGFAQGLRDGNLLDIENIVDIVRFAGNTRADAIALQPYLQSLKKIDDAEREKIGNPFDLLHSAGYEFVEYADTLEKQNAIKKYFRRGEELCTFKNEHRYEENYIINAVKYNADEIQPSPNPRRQDEYGTSVISIQIAKNGSRLKITNRYNHTINKFTDPEHSNPDNTFDANPDNIITGLSAALKLYFNIDWHGSKVLPENVKLIGDRLIKYDYDICNTYIGPDFWESHGEIHKLDKNSQYMMDYFVWDNKEKKLLNIAGAQDGFVDAFEAETNGKNVVFSGNSKQFTLSADGVVIVRVDNGCIVGVNMPHIVNVERSFLGDNKMLSEISLPNVTRIDMDFLDNNTALEKIDFPNVREIGKGFVYSNQKILSVNLPNVENIGDYFLGNNTELENLSLPNAKTIGRDFLVGNSKLGHISLPRAMLIDNNFLYRNKELRQLDLPNLTVSGNKFLYENQHLAEINMPRVQSIGWGFLRYNNALIKLDLPRLELIGYDFVAANNTLRELNLPRLTEIYRGFMGNNESLETVNLASVKNVPAEFLYYNEKLSEINLQSAQTIGGAALLSNQELKKISLPNVRHIGWEFLQNNEKLSEIKIPNVQSIEGKFLYSNQDLEHLDLPRAEYVDAYFLYSNKKLNELNMPRVLNVGVGFLENNRNIVWDADNKKIDYTFVGRMRRAGILVQNKVQELQKNDIENMDINSGYDIN